MIFLVYDLPACYKKAEILPLASALVVHLRSQFNHAFALLVSMPRLKQWWSLAWKSRAVARGPPLDFARYRDPQKRYATYVPQIFVAHFCLL